jgi:predicted GIY-YIG superfamily endonuclease
MSFYAYMLRCSDGSYYIGHTDSLERRIAQHQHDELPGYTHKRRPVTLMWSQDFPSRIEALEAERQLKGWTRTKKEALAAGLGRGTLTLAQILRYGSSASLSPYSGRTGLGG